MDTAAVLFLLAFFVPPAAVVLGVLLVLTPTGSRRTAHSHAGRPVAQH